MRQSINKKLTIKPIAIEPAVAILRYSSISLTIKSEYFPIETYQQPNREWSTQKKVSTKVLCKFLVLDLSPIIFNSCFNTTSTKYRFDIIAFIASNYLTK